MSDELQAEIVEKIRSICERVIEVSASGDFGRGLEREAVVSLEILLALPLPANEGPGERDPCDCMDCGLPDAEMPLDCVVTGEQWNLICPEEGGVLCASCMVKRANKLPNVVNVCARIIFGDDYIDSGDVAGGKFWQMMKRLDAAPAANEGPGDKLDAAWNAASDEQKGSWEKLPVDAAPAASDREDAEQLRCLIGALGCIDGRPGLSETECSIIREAIRRLRQPDRLSSDELATAVESLLTLSLPNDVSGRAMVDAARATVVSYRQSAGFPVAAPAAPVSDQDDDLLLRNLDDTSRLLEHDSYHKSARVVREAAARLRQPDREDAIEGAANLLSMMADDAAMDTEQALHFDNREIETMRRISVNLRRLRQPDRLPDGRNIPLEHGMNCPGDRYDEQCVCGLEWRIKLRTEQEMHAAWRKRATEAENALASQPDRLREAGLVLDKLLKSLRDRFLDVLLRSGDIGEINAALAAWQSATAKEGTHGKI